jgi:hypothetical protein
MPLDFPASPTVNQSYNGYVWSGTAWEAATPNAVSLTGQVIVADAAARDVLYPSPVQGNAVFRNDLGYEETYYGLYNASTNPGGRAAAGWYSNQRNVGLVSVIPPTVNFSGGSATTNTLGEIVFTAVTSVSLNNVFSSTYRNYRMVLNVPVSSALTSIAIRFRNGTTDNSANSYFQFWTMKRISGATQDNTGGPSTSYALMSKSSTYSYGVWSGDIMSPNISNQATTANGIGFSADGTGSYNLINTVLFDPNTSFDGITIFSTSGTMTGSVSIYGYNA